MLSTIFLILLFVLLIFRRRIIPWLLLFFVGKLIKKIEQNGQKTQQPAKEEKQKPSLNIGEYIDYEEIDWSF